MDKLEIAVDRIKNCHLCEGKGVYTWSNGEDYDFENCVCNEYEIIFDHDGEVIWDNGLLSEPTLLMTGEAR
jgi:hypothetical protein